MKTRTPTYYLAYGSNLHLGQMKMRCPGSKPMVQVELHDWALVFRGVADIVPHVGGLALGALYTITAADEAALDRYEGYRASAPRLGMYRKVYMESVVRGKKALIMFYVMNANHIDPPSARYYQTIMQGFQHWNMPTETLVAARESAKSTSVQVYRDSVKRNWPDTFEKYERLSHLLGGSYAR